MKKLPAYLQSFLDYGYKGDGRYHLYCYGSRHYNYTSFHNFMNHYPNCIEKIGRGNDAPRGGTVGYYYDVKFTPEFHDRFNPYFKAKLEHEEKQIQEEKEKDKYLKQKYGDQKEYLSNKLDENPEKLFSLCDIIHSESSHKWRNKIRMKVTRWFFDEKFSDMRLSAAEISDVVFSKPQVHVYNNLINQ